MWKVYTGDMDVGRCGIKNVELLFARAIRLSILFVLEEAKLVERREAAATYSIRKAEGAVWATSLAERVDG